MTGEVEIEERWVRSRIEIEIRGVGVQKYLIINVRGRDRGE